MGTTNDSSKKNEGKKLKPQDKVKMLETAVCEAGLDELREVLDREKPFEFTARALGHACAFGGMEKVKLLLEAGANFAYKIGIGFQRKYNIMKWMSNSYEYPLDFWADMAYGDWYDYEHGPILGCRMKNGNEEQLLPEGERTQIALYLLEQNTPGFNAGKLLYYAILWGNFTLADALRNAGVGLSQECWAWLTETPLSLREGGAERQWFTSAVRDMTATDKIKVLTQLQDLLDKQGKKLAITKVQLNRWMTYPERDFDGNILRFLAERTDISRISKMDLMKCFVDQERIDLIDICAQNDWLRNLDQRDKLINYAMEKKKSQTLAWLLDYKNRTADFAAEEQRRERILMRQLSVPAPDSVRAMRMIWKWENQGDGSLCITDYKGSEINVTVPEKIGKKMVTALARDWGCNVFSYTMIVSVRLPETIRRIGTWTFGYCTNLTSVTIPDSVTSIGDNAFIGCTSLTIHAHAGSYAEQYAKEKGIPFEAIQAT